MSISIVIITHNRYEYACAALESAWAQTCEPDQVILIDDGSPFDFKTRYVEDHPDLAKKTDFVRLDDLGPSSARNAGVEVATGDYLTFLDDDDQMDERYLESCFELIKNGKADLIVTPMVNFDGTGKMWDGKSLPPKFDLDEVMMRNVGVVGSNIFMTAKGFKDVGGFDANLQGSEDKDFLLKFMLNNKKIVRNPERLIRYRYHPATQVSGQNKFHKFQLQGKKRFYALYKSKMTLKTRWALYTQFQYFILNGESCVFDKLCAFCVLAILNPKYLAKTLLMKIGRG